MWESMIFQMFRNIFHLTLFSLRVQFTNFPATEESRRTLSLSSSLDPVAFA